MKKCHLEVEKKKTPKKKTSKLLGELFCEY